MDKTNFSRAFEPVQPLEPSESFEPFELRYLDALAQEGIDLDAFLNGWCRAMRDDLDRLQHLRCELESAQFSAQLPALLHRVSGAVGLVGAQHLMQALRHASTSPSERNAVAIDALIARSRTLIAQLEAAPYPYRSTRP
ncbi:hypothetical protein LMG28727_07567 [Paraburkholderia kirstenboschensis]|uniref:hypothetical protein n=1 Tax=Paraburkholderia kirstenboschensis TaxID=1245436 RepID=UPI000A7D8E2F|nr:hypothetical protein [Paraburkholderia kirstenboschensis]CAD6561841.1 hypothetical protein LMG28727_07567 [Paraburkholderia kirstenboschensis]